MDRVRAKEDINIIINFLLYVYNIPNLDIRCDGCPSGSVLCACMDFEQMGMLVSGISDQVEWKVLEGDCFYVEWAEEDLKKEWLNPSCKYKKKGYELILEKGERRWEKDIENWGSNSGKKQAVASIPIVEMINLRRPLGNRNSLVYLCIGEFAPVFLQRYVKAVCVLVIHNYLKHISNREILWKANVLIEELISEFSKNKIKKTLKSLLYYYERYIDGMKGDLTLQPYRIACRKYYFTISDRAMHQEESWYLNVKMDDADRNELNHLYKIFICLLDLLGIAKEEYPNIFFLEIPDMTYHNIYSEIENILCSDLGGKKNDFLGKLQNLLLQNDISDEDLNELKRFSC